MTAIFAAPRNTDSFSAICAVVGSSRNRSRICHSRGVRTTSWPGSWTSRGAAAPARASCQRSARRGAVVLPPSRRARQAVRVGAAGARRLFSDSRTHRREARQQIRVAVEIRQHDDTRRRKSRKDLVGRDDTVAWQRGIEETEIGPLLEHCRDDTRRVARFGADPQVAVLQEPSGDPPAPSGVRVPQQHRHDVRPSGGRINGWRWHDPARLPAKCGSQPRLGLDMVRSQRLTYRLCQPRAGCPAMATRLLDRTSGGEILA